MADLPHMPPSWEGEASSSPAPTTPAPKDKPPQAPEASEIPYYTPRTAPPHLTPRESDAWYAAHWLEHVARMAQVVIAEQSEQTPILVDRIERIRMSDLLTEEISEETRKKHARLCLLEAVQNHGRCLSKTKKRSNGDKTLEQHALLALSTFKQCHSVFAPKRRESALRTSFERAIDAWGREYRPSENEPGPWDALHELTENFGIAKKNVRQLKKELTPYKKRSKRQHHKPT